MFFLIKIGLFLTPIITPSIIIYYILRENAQLLNNIKSTIVQYNELVLDKIFGVNRFQRNRRIFATIFNEDIKKVRYFLNKNINLDIVNQQGDLTPLYYTYRTKKNKIFTLFINHQPDLLLKTYKHNQNLLQKLIYRLDLDQFAERQDYQFINSILNIKNTSKLEEIVNHQDKYRRSSVHTLISKYMLLKQNNTQEQTLKITKKPQTAKQLPEILEKILQAKANPNTIMQGGYLPLQRIVIHALQNNIDEPLEDLIKILIKYGAGPDYITESSIQSARDLAKNNPEMLSLLRIPIEKAATHEKTAYKSSHCDNLVKNEEGKNHKIGCLLS